MKTFRKFGVASKNYDNHFDAATDTYGTKSGIWPPTPICIPENPFLEECKHARNVLEIGCGVGRNLHSVMTETNANYYGIDPNENMTRWFWEHGDNSKWRDRAVIGNSFDVLPKDLRVDLVLSIFVLQHIGFRPDSSTMDVYDIGMKIKEYTVDGCIWYMLEHNHEERDWLQVWLTMMEFVPVIKIPVESVPSLHEMTSRGTHDFIVIKERKK